MPTPTSANKVKFGLKEVHIAKITYGTDGNGNPTITYGTPFAMPGAVNLSLDPAGESADFYADNTKYFNAFSNQGYTGSLEMALVNNQFKADILGQVVDSNGAFVESADDTISDFALGFTIDGDKANKRHWLYCVQAQRPNIGSQTIETTKTPVTETLNITASARITDGAVRISMEKTDDNTAAYNGFFSAVYEKNISA